MASKSDLFRICFLFLCTDVKRAQEIYKLLKHQLLLLLRKRIKTEHILWGVKICLVLKFQLCESRKKSQIRPHLTVAPVALGTLVFLFAFIMKQRKMLVKRLKLLCNAVQSISPFISWCNPSFCLLMSQYQERILWFLC